MKGVTVTATGTDAQTAAIKDTLYTTKAKSLKLQQYGTLTLNATTTGVKVINVTHAPITYIPAYRVFAEVVPGSGQWYADAFSPGGITVTTDPANSLTFLAQMDNQNLQIIVSATAGNTYKLRYYVFEDKLI